MYRFPKEWHKTFLKDVAYVQTGLALGKNNVSDPISFPYLRVANVQDGYFDLREVKTVTLSRSQVIRYQLQDGDVLLTEGGDFDKLGRGCVWRSQVLGCLHQNHIFAVRPNNGVLNSDFFALLAGSGYGRAYFLSCAKKSTNLASMNSTQLKQMPLPVPPLWEQEGIVRTMAVWDKAVHQVGHLVDAMTRLKMGLMSQLLTGKRSFKKPQAGSRKQFHLGDLFVERNEINRIDLSLLAVTADRGVIFRDELDRKDSSSDDKRQYKRIAPGDIGYNTMRMWQGVSALSRLEGIISPAYTVCVPNELIDGQFASYLFKFPPVVHLFRRYSQGMVDDTLSLKFSSFAQIKVTIPPIVEQKHVAGLLGMLDQEIGSLRKLGDLFREQEKGLMQKFLTGEVRIKELSTL